MNTAEDQLSTYKSVHLNKKNVMTHFVGVPLIIWSLFVLLSLIEFPLFLPISENNLTLAMVFFAGVLVYYFALNWTLAVGAIVFLTPVLYTAQIVSKTDSAIWIAIIVFVIAWAIQFLGHHFEKAKPAFVDDLNQLLIGPLFLLAELFFAIGFLHELKQQITPMAVDKRRSFEQAKNQ